MNSPETAAGDFLLEAQELPTGLYRSDQDPIVIAGLTGTGKTALSLALADHFVAEGQPVEIINGDALQFYRGMDIGTAKLSTEEREKHPHHLFDILDVTETATVADFQARARAKILEIQNRSAIPILVGGSGLYLSAVFGKFDFPPSQEPIRTELELLSQTPAGQVELRKQLLDLDPFAEQNIDFANIRRVIRALEVIKITGKPFIAARPDAVSHWQHSTLFFLDGNREAIKHRLVERAARMYEQGLLEEVTGLLKNGLTTDSTAGQAIGYAQAISVLQGRSSRAEAIAETARLTQRFARRQRSWFNRNPMKIMVDYETTNLPPKIYEFLKQLPPSPVTT